MSATRKIVTSDGKTWFVGGYVEWSDNTDPATVIVPVNQLEGLSDADIGRAVRESLSEARFCVALCDADNIVANTGGRLTTSLPQYAMDKKPLLLEFAGRSEKIDQALAIIAATEARQLRRRPVVQRDRSGYIYLVEGQNCYKIGKSIDVPSRTRSFGLQLPFPTQLIHSIPTTDMVWAEAYMHQTFAHCRMNGEWFDLSPDEVAWICDIESLNPG